MKPSTMLRRRAPLWLAGLSLLWATACHEASPDKEYGDPTRLDSLTIQSGIWAQVLSPTNSVIDDQPQATLIVSAWTDDPDGALLVHGATVSQPQIPSTTEGAPGPNQRFHIPVELLHGQNNIAVVISEPDSGRRRVLDYPLHYEGNAPGLVVTGIARPIDGNCPEQPDEEAQSAISSAGVCVYGRASLASGRTIQRLSIQSPEGETVADAPELSFVLPVPLQANQVNDIQVRLVDSSSAATVRDLQIEHNDVPPTLGVSYPPGNYLRTSDATVHVQCEADDDNGLHELLVYANDTLLQRLDLRSDCAFDLRLRIGLNRIRLVATDISGNEADAHFEVFRDRISTLNASTGSGGETVLQLDKSSLSELLNIDAQKELILAAIGLRPFLYGAIAAIRDPYSFGSDPEDFGPTEYNFYRLLNLSADTANLMGTSLEELSALSLAIGLPTPRILAELLNLEVDEPALSTDLIVDVLLDNLIRTHPEVIFDEAGDPILEIRLYDALHDLRPLAERFGPDPATGHPGIIGGAIEAEVLEPGFLLSAKAISHLIAYEGIDAARGSKDFIYVLEGDQVLSLDVYDEETFSIVGLVDEPTVEVTIALNEHPGFVAAGTVQHANPDPERPGAYRGNNAGWQLDPWVLERIVLEIVYRRFVVAHEATNYETVLSYDAGSIENAAQFVWNRGWFITTTAGGLGAPPPPQYAWDALSELAQVRLHDGGIPEGEANARFLLSNVPVGVDADSLVHAIRPALDEQSDRLSELLLGHEAITSSGADFYYVRTLSNGRALLHFRHPDDGPLDGHFPRPGFFSDESLTQRLDSTEDLAGDGNTTHRKVVVNNGDILFFADESDSVYQLSILAVRASQIDLIVTEVTAP